MVEAEALHEIDKRALVAALRELGVEVDDVQQRQQTHPRAAAAVAAADEQPPTEQPAASTSSTTPTRSRAIAAARESGLANSKSCSLMRPTASSVVAGGAAAKLEKQAKEIKMLKSRLRLAKPPTSKPAGGGGPVQLGAAACSWEREQQTSASSLRETNERQAKEIESLKRKLRWALHLRAPERIYTPHLHPDHLTDSGPQAPLSYQAGGGDFLVEGHAEAYGAALTVTLPVPAAVTGGALGHTATHTVTSPRVSVLRETIARQEGAIEELAEKLRWEQHRRAGDRHVHEMQEQKLKTE